MVELYAMNIRYIWRGKGVWPVTELNPDLMPKNFQEFLGLLDREDEDEAKGITERECL
jgi:hypothetical protein